MCHREMHSQEWIPEVRHRIHICLQCTRRLIRVKIEAPEWQNAIPLRKSELPCYAIGIQSSSIDHITCLIPRICRLNCPTSLLHEGNPTFDHDALCRSVSHHRLQHFCWINC